MVGSMIIGRSPRWWDAFLLRDVERRIASYPAGRQEKLQAILGAAAGRMRAADDLVDGYVPEAFALYREAAALYMAAFLTTTSQESLPQPLRLDDIYDAFLRAAEERSVTAIDSRMTELIERMRTPDLLLVDRMDAAAAAQLGQKAQTLVKQLAGLVDIRTVGEVRLQRVLRTGGLAVVVIALLALGVSTMFRTENVALRKTVTVSGIHPNSTAMPGGLTDGVTSGSYGVHTSLSDNPWVQVDLAGVYAIERVVIYNRGDGSFDDGLPMVLQFSQDGTRFQDIETRATSFSQVVPWTALTHRQRARYVRIKGTKGKYVCLSELEVFGKKVF
jgi:F5/8 type C domain